MDSGNIGQYLETTAKPEVEKLEEGTVNNNNTIQFYNYHEYRAPFNDSVIITHHPNPYPFSYLDMDTRVVRIPRLTETDYPQFSTCLPGHEPGAIINNDYEDDKKYQFISTYTYMNQRFGNSSISPLSNYIDSSEFEEIVIKINKILHDIYSSNKANVIWLIINIIFLDIPNIIYHLLRKIFNLNVRNTKLESYVDEINIKFKNQNKPIRIVQPRESGFLSLDWIIPSQNPDTNLN